MCLRKPSCFMLPGAVPLTVTVAALVLLLQAVPAYAQTCLQDEYNQVQKQKLNCTANDVKIAKVTNIRDPLTGAALTSCVAGTTFNFLADFEIVTTSSQARENIGLYIATHSTTQALTGSCVDNIISPPHPCPSNSSITCGSDNYHETDPPPDNCGDTSSKDSSPTFGSGTEKVTLEIDNFACTPPAGSTTLVLPNCTSWQIPGGTIQCVTSPPSYPYPFNGPGGTPTAIPGSPSKCNCDVIPLPITVVTQGIVQKACTTTLTPGPATFTQSPTVTQSPTTCNAGPEGSTVTYTASITNTSASGNLIIDQICDSAYGTIFRSSSAPSTLAACAGGSSGKTASNIDCPPGGASGLAAGASGTCTFTATVGENVSGLTDTVTATGHSSLDATSTITQTSNSVTVTSSDAPSTATVTKGVVSTTAACATVRYSVDVKNTSGVDEVLSLSALNDTAFGNITQVQGSVLGTTCGVPTGSPGLGTLSGSTGAGALPASLPVAGTDYTCQFDAQFCSALDGNSCISNTDKVNGTLAGDEGEAVSVTANTLTVKECLTTTVTSQ